MNSDQLLPFTGLRSSSGALKTPRRTRSLYLKEPVGVWVPTGERNDNGRDSVDFFRTQEALFLSLRAAVEPAEL